MQIPEVFAIVVTYNGANWIKKCLHSLLTSSIPVNVIIIDNCSTDNTLDIIEKSFNDIFVFKAPYNLGFGAANNKGIEIALNKGAQYLFLLNQDAWVEEHTIEKLLDFSKRNIRYGILSPVHLNSSGTEFDFKFNRYIQSNNIPLQKKDLLLRNNNTIVFEIPFVNAAAWLIPKITFSLIGEFDSLFFHYGEDVNFCQRVRYHGLKIGILSNSYIVHDRKDKAMQFNINIFFNRYKSSVFSLLADINKSWFEVKRIYYREVFINILKIVGCIIIFKFLSLKLYFKKIFFLFSCLGKVKKSREKNIRVRYSN